MGESREDAEVSQGSHCIRPMDERRLLTITLFLLAGPAAGTAHVTRGCKPGSVFHLRRLPTRRLSLPVNAFPCAVRPRVGAANQSRDLGEEKKRTEMGCSLCGAAAAQPRGAPSCMQASLQEHPNRNSGALWEHSAPPADICTCRGRVLGPRDQTVWWQCFDM